MTASETSLHIRRFSVFNHFAS